MSKDIFKINGFAEIGSLVGRINELLAEGKSPYVAIQEEARDRSQAQNRLMHKWISDIAKSTGHSIVEEAGRIKYTYFVPMMSYAEDQEAVAAQWVIKDLEKRLGYERIVKLLGLSVISSTRHLSVKHFEEALNNMMEGERQHNLTDPISYTGSYK